MQVRRAQRLVEDALPRHVVETLMHELHEPPAAMPSPGAWGSHPHSQSLELLSDYEHLVGQHHERHSHRLSQYQHISGQDAGAQPYHLHAQYLEGGAGHGHEHHGRQARGGHGEGHHGHYVHFSGGSSQHAGQEQHHSSHSHSQDSEGQQPQGQQQRQPCLPNVREDEPQGGGWFDTARPGPSHLSLTDLPSQEAAARKSPARSAVSTPGGLVVLGPSDAAQGAGWRGSGSGPSLPSLRSSGESSACTPYCPAGYGARLSLSGSSGPLAPVVPPRLSFGSTSSQSQGYGGAVNQDSDKADSTYAESHPAACVLFAGERLIRRGVGGIGILGRSPVQGASTSSLLRTHTVALARPQPLYRSPHTSARTCAANRVTQQFSRNHPPAPCTMLLCRHRVLHHHLRRHQPPGHGQPAQQPVPQV